MVFGEVSVPYIGPRQTISKGISKGIVPVLAIKWEIPLFFRFFGDFFPIL